jgi:hypothetical protein
MLLNPGYRASLPKRPWFLEYAHALEWFNIASAAQLLQDAPDVPPGWLRPQRKQLPAPVLERRCTLEWDVPLLDILGESNPQPLDSGSLYVAGTGVALLMVISRPQWDGPTSIGLYVKLADYVQLDTQLCSPAAGLACSYTIQRQVPALEEEWATVVEGRAVLSAKGWGSPNAIVIPTFAASGDFVIDGSLNLRLTITDVSLSPA